MTPVVRRATVEDRDAYRSAFEEVAGEGRWIGTELPVDWDARTPWEEMVGRSNRLTLAVDDEGKIVGGLFMEVGGGGRADLGMFLVDGYRGLGLGSQLLRTAVDWARDAGAHKVCLEYWPHNEGARRLYEKHGFADEGVRRRHYRRNDGSLWDCVSMGLVLDETSPGSPY